MVLDDWLAGQSVMSAGVCSCTTSMFAATLLQSIARLSTSGSTTSWNLARLGSAFRCSPSTRSVKDQAVPDMRPRPGTVVAGMAELIMPSVTPCVAAMCRPMSSAPPAMPEVPVKTLF
jgi:hypothetical protein